MKIRPGVYPALAVLGMGLGMVAAPGCEGDQTTTPAAPSARTTEPKLTPPTRVVEDLKKDLKPPVVIKPDRPGTTETVPAPKHE